MFVPQYVSIPRINRFYLDSQPTIQRFPLKVLSQRMLSWFLRCRFLRVWGRFLLQLGGQPVPQGAHQVTSSSPGLLATPPGAPAPQERHGWQGKRRMSQRTRGVGTSGLASAGEPSEIVEGGFVAAILIHRCQTGQVKWEGGLCLRMEADPR